jgi:hypothetical protein
MSRRDKAAWILARLAMMHRPAAMLGEDDILSKATEKELDFYYFWLVKGGKI